MRLPAGKRGLRVVVGERDVEFALLADAHPEQVVLEPGNEPVLTDDQRHPLSGAALESLAVARALEADHDVVALLHAPVLDGLEYRVLVAQLVDHLVDPGVVDRLDLRGEVEVAVVAELDRWSDLDGRLEDEALGLVRLDDFDVRRREGQHQQVGHGVAVAVVDQMLDGLVEHGTGAEDAVEHHARCLAGPKAGNLGTPAEPLDGVADGGIETIRRQLDFEDDRASGGGSDIDFHRPRSIRAVRGPGRQAPGASRGRPWARGAGVRSGDLGPGLDGGSATRSFS